MRYKENDLVEIYHPELERKVVYEVIREDRKFVGVRHPVRMAEDASMSWLISKGRKIK